MVHGTPPAAVGSVTAINGTTLTIASRGFGKPGSTLTATTTYSVDASTATVMKNNATSTLSAVAVGDFVLVQGTKNGTSITATTIRDGMMMRGGPSGTRAPGTPGTVPPGNVQPPIQGNGEPVVAGTVSAIGGASLTVTTKSNVTYTVDTTNAKIVQGQDTVSLSNVSTGDSVIIQGTVNGTSVTASSVIDQKAPSATGTGATPPRTGFFGSIGQFFSHLFGF